MTLGLRTKLTKDPEWETFILWVHIWQNLHGSEAASGSDMLLCCDQNSAEASKIWVEGGLSSQVSVSLIGQFSVCLRNILGGPAKSLLL